jgi:hypothetical protein
MGWKVFFDVEEKLKMTITTVKFSIDPWASW